MPGCTRIASLISSATEMLYLLGLVEHVVGVSHECDFPPQVAGKPRLTRSLIDASADSRAIDDQVRSLAESGSALYAIDVEMLTKLAPDLIITQAQCDVCAVRYQDVVDAVQSSPVLAPVPILALNPMTVWDVLEDITRVGQAAGADLAARDVVADLRGRVDAISQKTAQLPDAFRPRVACLEWIDPPMLAGNWMPELVALAGGHAGLVVAGAHSGYASWQAIVDFDPQVIVIMPCGFDLDRAITESQSLPALAEWSQLSAVRQGRVFSVDGNAYFNRSGPRLIESLEILAHLFHPNLFAPPALDRAWQQLEARSPHLFESRP